MPMTGWWGQQPAPNGYDAWARQEQGLNGRMSSDPTRPRLDPVTGQYVATQNQDMIVSDGGAPQVPPSFGGSSGQYPLVPGGPAPLMQPWSTPFQAPTAQTMELDPGYRFAVDEGNQGIQRSAAARGTLLTGGLLKALGRYNTGMAAQQYDTIYNRASNNYDRARDIFTSNQDRPFNMLRALSKDGQVSAQGLSGAGSSYAANQGNLLTGQGNVNAAGQVGSANAWGGAANDIANNAMLWFLMNRNRAPQTMAGT